MNTRDWFCLDDTVRHRFNGRRGIVTVAESEDGEIVEVDGYVERARDWRHDENPPATAQPRRSEAMQHLNSNKTAENPLGTSEIDRQLSQLRNNLAELDVAAVSMEKRFSNVVRIEPPAPTGSVAPKGVQEAMQSPMGQSLQEMNNRLLATIEMMRDLERRACL